MPLLRASRYWLLQVARSSNITVLGQHYSSFIHSSGAGGLPDLDVDGDTSDDPDNREAGQKTVLHHDRRVYRIGRAMARLPEI